MSRKRANARGLYPEGIRDGRPREAISEYSGDRYTQHSTGVHDGPEGLYAQADLFPLEGGLIVEHWDAGEPAPPEDELVNSGKF